MNQTARQENENLEHPNFINGHWVISPQTTAIYNKYSHQQVGLVHDALPHDVDNAIQAAANAAGYMAKLSAHRRAVILLGTAALLRRNRELLARTIAAEAGKAIKFARGEVGRAIDTFTLAGEEAKRIHGETIPLDAVSSGEGCFGFWHRRPVGVVAAVTPFNFPLNLVAHKVAPALAAGNSVVLKPAEQTPLAAGLLCKLLEEAGLPAGGLNLIHGKGETVGHQLVNDPRVNKVTFTGSPPVGKQIAEQAGLRKVTLELGNNAPVVVGEDADLEAAAKKCAVGGFYNAGQVCISVQRIYVVRKVYDAFCNRLVELVDELEVGDPLLEETDVGPMIGIEEAERVERWVGEAVSHGARVLIGGEREGAMYYPTVLVEVRPDMDVMKREAFGPVVCVNVCESFAAGLEEANESAYGLQAAVFTKDVDRVMMAVRGLRFGGVIVNEGPHFRADHMPYGGMRGSGLGREGVRYAVEEMTEVQTVVIRSDVLREE